MLINDLRSYLSVLEQHHELSRITASVNPCLEIATITNRICKQPEGGRALFFEHPAGCRFPVATNLFGSVKRVGLALGVGSLDALTRRLGALLDMIPEIDLPHCDCQIASLPEFSRFVQNISAKPDPHLVSSDQPDLTCLPFLQCWPEDGSDSGHQRYITLSQVFTADPEGKAPNCGLYRVQIRGPRELAIQWKAGSGAARHAEAFQRQGKTMPVAITLGGDPAMLFSAMFPLPGELDEVTFAGFLRGKSLQTASCSTVPLRVPIGVEVVIEGYVEPGHTVVEGPFGNHTGFYSPAAPAALMQVTAIRCRPDAIIPATVVGPPPMEDCWMAVAWERLLLAFLRKLIPVVADIHFPFEWIFHQSAIISLENPTPDMVRKTVAQVWRLPWFSSARILIVVDAAFGSPKLPQAAWRCVNLLEYRHDLIRDETTDRVAFDATGCRTPRNRVVMDERIVTLVDRRWREYGLA